MPRPPIPDDELRAIARLASLDLPADRLPVLRAQLAEILDAVEAIAGLDLEGVPEWTPASAPVPPPREDEPRPPRPQGGFLRVPRVRPR